MGNQKKFTMQELTDNLKKIKAKDIMTENVITVKKIILLMILPS